MTKDQMRALRPGDVVQSLHTGLAYVVTGNYGNRVTAVRTADISNPVEWGLIESTETDEKGSGHGLH